MKKFFLTALVFALVAAIIVFIVYFIMNKDTAKKAMEGDMIITSIYPYELLVRQIMGDQVVVMSLIPPNASPHTWSPNPSDMQALENADLIISNGMGLETNLIKVFEQHNAKHLEIAALLDSTLYKSGQAEHEDGHEAEHEHEAEHNDEHGHSHAGINPHLWTSPELLINIANALSAALISAFPNKTEVIKQNTLVLIRELMDADQQIQTERAALQNPAIITYHDSFHYFTQRYDIEFIGAVQSSPGQEPSPKELSELGKKIKQHKIKTIFIEPQMNPKSAEVLANEFKLNLLTIDPLGTTLNVKTISEFILKNWAIIRSGL